MSIASERSELHEHPGRPPHRTARWRASFERGAFVLLSTVIVVINSEKFYWYPQGFPGFDHVELIAFYVVGMLAFFATVRRFGLNGLDGVVLGAAAFSLVVEGAVTPVMYEDGPLPLLAIYFLGWHGVLSLGLVWYGFRRLALDRQHRILAACSLAYGAFIGLWSTVYWLPSQIADLSADPEGGWDVGQWSVGKYSLYVGLMSSVLFAAHWLIGHVWPTEWRMGRRGSWMLIGIVGLGVAAWTVAVPFAPIKFLVLAWLIRFLVIKSQRSDGGTSELTVFESLAGCVRVRDVAPILLIAPAAVTVYGAMYLLGPSTTVLDAIYWSVVAATVVAGAGAVVWSFRRRRRRRR